jgi:hypothetical protein
VPNLRRTSYLVLGILALQLRRLQLLLCADPLAREWVAEAKRVEHERTRGAIFLAYCPNRFAIRAKRNGHALIAHRSPLLLSVLRSERYAYPATMGATLL